jgi:hyperosmotically inducible periplasmic protein
MNKFVFALGMPALMLCLSAYGQTGLHTSDSATTAPDNTKSNQQPSNRGAVADAQKNNSADLDLAKRIRQSVVADKSLSTYGHNVKIVAVEGTVTLNGVVTTADEKMQIAKLATSIAGAGKVVDQVKVASSK